jgi:hypothetical protein
MTRRKIRGKNAMAAIFVLWPNIIQMIMNVENIAAAVPKKLANFVSLSRRNRVNIPIPKRK